MPAPTDPKLKAAIEQAYINSNLSPKELSEKFDGVVSDRTIERWIEKEKWDAKRKSLKVIEFARQPKQERPTVRTAANSENPIEIANMVIADLQAEMRSDMAGKDKAAVANALKPWVEYREKLQPKTATEIAELAITAGIDPDTFIEVLGKAWEEIA